MEYSNLIDGLGLIKLLFFPPSTKGTKSTSRLSQLYPPRLTLKLTHIFQRGFLKFAISIQPGRLLSSSNTIQ